jgi:hypothetical protein
VSRRTIHKFARSAAHTGHDVGRLCHVAISENSDLSGGADEFDGMEGAVDALRTHIDDYDLSARFL